MHILVLPSFYPSAARPNTGIFFQDQAQALHRAGHEVGVLVAPRLRELAHYVRHNRRLPNLTSAEREAEALYRMYWGWFPRVFPLITAWLHKGAGMRAFARYCAERGKPDVIHAHNVFYSGYMAAEIKRRWKVPVVLTEHSSNFVRGRVFLPGQQRVTQRTLDGCDACCAVGQAVAHALQQYTHNVVQVIGNMVDTAFFDFAPPPQQTFTFAAAGQFIPIKRFDLLLNAFAAAFRGENVRLCVGGDGVLARRLKQQADTLGITGQVTFLGLLNREQMRQLYHNSHALVSSSAVETFGLTLAEAMSCGRPVIATRSGGPEGFVTPETGLLVPVGDVAALADALRKMHTNYHAYVPAAIRVYCEGRFSETVIVKQLEEVYKQVRQNLKLNL